MSTQYVPPHLRRVKSHTFYKDVSLPSRPSSYDNKRYSPDKKYCKNYVDIRSNVSNYDYSQKIKHIKGILSRRKEIEERKICYPEFLKLMYDIRAYGVVISYFPEGSKYHALFEGYENHPGWRDFMTKKERKILSALDNAVRRLKINPLDIDSFEKADKMFGMYRYSRWVRSFE